MPDSFQLREKFKKKKGVVSDEYLELVNERECKQRNRKQARKFKRHNVHEYAFTSEEE